MIKILFCFNRDIYCQQILSYILPFVKEEEVKIYFSGGVGKVPDLEDLRQLKIYEKAINEHDVGDVEVLNFKNINQDGLEYLKSWAPDLIISVRFGQIFKGEIINLPKFGIINLHSGILPEFRGVMATFWTMLNDRKQIGCTLHFISDASIDTGDIIEISYLDVKPDKSMIWHLKTLYKNCALPAIIKALNKIKNNEKLIPIVQDNSKSNYFSYPNSQDLEKFKQKFKLFDSSDLPN